MHHHPSVLIIGGGRVGQMLGYLWVSHQLVNVIAVCNSTLVSAQKACQFIGQGQAHCDLQTCPSANIILVTTPDDRLPSIMAWLSTWSKMQEDTIVMHCSGCLSSIDFHLPDHTVYELASVHPVMSVASPEAAIGEFDQIMCGYEGSSTALSVLLPLFEAIGGVPFELIPQQKAAYHAGMVMASNYLVGLADSSRACLQQAGLSEEVASSLVGQIMQQTLININSSHNLSEVLTGPIKRGDENTVLKHCDVLKKDLKPLYQLLGRHLLPLTTHSSDVVSRLNSVLTDNTTKGL